MVDMTNCEEQKSDFITNILFDCSGENFYVVYADDSIEKNAFDIENYNEVLLKMEKEFLTYKENYLKKLSHERLKNAFKTIMVDLATAGSIFLLYNLCCDDILKIATMLVAVMVGIIFHQKYNNQIYELNSDIDSLYLMEQFVNRKDEFAVDIKDSETGEIKKWYVVNLSNIYKIGSPSILNKYTDEKVKLRKIPEFLKKKCGLIDA